MGNEVSKPKQANGSTANFRTSKSFSPASLSDELKSSWNNSSEHTATRSSPSTAASPTNDGVAEDSNRHQSLSHTVSPRESMLRVQKQPTMDSLAASVVRTLSRRNSKGTYSISTRSSNTQLQEGSQLSSVLEQPLDVQSAIAILQELRKTASPEDMAALHKALMPVASRDSLAQSMSSEAPEDIDPAMTRRRSYAQPGIATRFGFGKNERAVLRKSVPVPTSQPKQPWTKDMMGASPLARLSSIDLMEPLSESMEIRAQTPSELDYSQLGNLGHGTLQVVNGCPSPVPSMASPGRTGGRTDSDERDENYFTASERGDESRPTSKQTSSMLQSAWKPPPIAMESQPRGRGRILEGDLQTRGKSPLKQEVRITSMEAAHDIDADSVYSGQLRPESSMNSLHAQSKRRFSFEETPEPSLPPPPAPRLRGASQSADSLAKDYEAELPPSPHKPVQRQNCQIEPASLPRLEDVVPRPMSTNLQPTLPNVSLTKQEPTLPNMPLLEHVVRRPMSSVYDIREQTVILPPKISQEPAPISPRRPLDSHPAPSRSPPDLPILLQQKQRRPVGVKADSGYGSNGSARNSTSENVSPVEGKEYLATVGYINALPTVPRQGQRFYSSERQGPASLSLRIGQIAGKNKEPIPATEAGAEDDVVDSIEKDPSPQEKMKRGKSWRKSVRKSFPRLMSAESFTDDFSKSTSAVSDTTSSEQKPKKLQKRRPLSQPPINLSDRHVLASGGVPRVPSTVFSRYSTRLSESPAMQHLEQTYGHGLDTRESSFEPSTGASASKVSLPSCFFPDAHLPDELPTPPAHRRMSWGRKSFRRSRSRSKSYVDEPEVLSTGISDFGTTGQSLGTSPYDAAMPPMPRRPSAGASTQPHHLSMRDTWSEAPREGWDDQTAARIAQTRSRERASQLYDEQLEAEALQRVGRRTMPPRANSYHPDMPVLEVHAPAPKIPAPRPQSMHANGVYNGSSRSQYVDSEPTPNDFRRSASRPRTPHAQTRDVSPVKNLVSAFEQKASKDITALPPMPTIASTQQPDWSDPSRVWRERRLNAAQTTSPPPAQQQHRPLPPTQTQTMSVTTTTISNIGTKTVSGNQRPPLQMNRKSMPQMRQTFGPVSHTTTTTTYAGNRASYINTVSGAYRDAPAGTTTTTRNLYGIDFGDVPVRVI